MQADGLHSDFGAHNVLDYLRDLWGEALHMLRMLAYHGNEELAHGRDQVLHVASPVGLVGEQRLSKSFVHLLELVVACHEESEDLEGVAHQFSLVVLNDEDQSGQ